MKSADEKAARFAEAASVAIRPTRWPKYFMDLAERTAQMSKDPTTQVGAVVVQDRRVVGMGYNGFPAGIPDDPKMLGDREAKLARMIHAEMNALLQAGRAAAGATLYVHGFAAPPCTRCTAHIIQAGIIHVVVAGQPAPARWVADFTESSSMLRVSGVPVTYL